MEQWKNFQDKKISVILDDKPSPYPTKKVGILSGITETHLILLREDNKTEALRLSDIRRVELVR